MNWTETREKLIKCGIPAERLAAEWRPGVNLRGASLSEADLSGASLSEASLSEANLRRADLSRADLHGAYLHGANLRGANLHGANLHGVDLRGVDLRGANLHGAIVQWRSHDMIAEILLRAAGDNPARRMLAGLILISRDWCWDEFLALDIDPELREWALAELRQWVRPGDHAPEILKAIPPAAE